MLTAPQLLIAFRAACAPAMFILACYGFPGPLLAGILAAAFVSDIFDGVIARRMGTSTPALRYADTLVDTVFYTTSGVALWILVPGAFDGAWPAIVALVTTHVSRATFELAKYGRTASYHMWSSKALGIVLASALGLSFALEHPTALLTFALWMGVINELEGFAASAILPVWRSDVPSLWHAAGRLSR
jgi:phosphatidylglycerophosphate synthase